MINLFKTSNQAIIATLLPTIYILNFLIVGSIFTYSVLYYFDIKILSLSYLLLIFSLTALSLKLYYWNSLKININNKVNASKLFLLRITFCIFTYFTPTYYIFKKESFIMNEDIILITLIIVSIIAFIGFCLERYLFFIESKINDNLFYANKLN